MTAARGVPAMVIDEARKFEAVVSDCIVKSKMKRNMQRTASARTIHTKNEERGENSPGLCDFLRQAVFSDKLCMEY